MTPSSIIITVVIIIVIVILIRWAGILGKKSRIHNEDPWDHLSSDSNYKSDKPESVTNTIRINRNEGWEEEPTVGESVTLWLKPNTNTILFYERGTVGGEGLVGWIEDKSIADHLRKEGLASATVLSFDKRSCTIELTLLDEYEPELRKKREEDFREKLLKPYKPRQDWTLSFNMKGDLAQDIKVQIKHLDSETVLGSDDSIHKAIWLEDEKNYQISNTSYQDYNNLIKTLRAFYSGLDIKIKDFKKGKDNNWELTIGI